MRYPETAIEWSCAMRYGNPSIRSGMQKLSEAGCDRIVVMPLYPQYASSSTGSTVELVYKIAGELWNTPFITVVPPFYDDPRFISAFAEVGGPVLSRLKPDHVLMSFHGLPERQVIKSDGTGRHCLQSPDCCDRIVDANRNCYRAQCFATARALANALGLGQDDYTVSFQSRLGRTPWIKPYTDEWLAEMSTQGKKKVAVFCPAFVSDCLETLEEIGIGAKEEFDSSGGTLELVPSLNDSPKWIAAVIDIILETLGLPPAKALAPAPPPKDEVAE